MKIAVYPGSFDPITNGHLDILQRSLKVFDKVILLLATNGAKKGRFTTEERLTMMEEAVKGIPGVEVDSYDGLTVEYCLKHDAKAIIRGLRAVTDFEYEFQLSAANHYLSKEVDMVFFMAAPSTTFISSSAVDELAMNGADVSSLVPFCVAEAYSKKRGQ